MIPRRLRPLPYCSDQNPSQREAKNLKCRIKDGNMQICDWSGRSKMNPWLRKNGGSSLPQSGLFHPQKNHASRNPTAEEASSPTRVLEQSPRNSHKFPSKNPFHEPGAKKHSPRYRHKTSETSYPRPQTSQDGIKTAPSSIGVKRDDLGFGRTNNDKQLFRFITANEPTWTQRS